MKEKEKKEERVVKAKRRQNKDFVPLPRDILKIRLFKTQNILLMSEQTKSQLIQQLMDEFNLGFHGAEKLYYRAKNLLKKEMENERDEVYKGIRNECFHMLDGARKDGNIRDGINIIKLLMSLYGLEKKEISLEMKDDGKLNDVDTDKLLEVIANEGESKNS